MVLTGDTETEVQNMLKYYIKSHFSRRVSNSKLHFNIALEKGIHRKIQNISSDDARQQKTNILVLDSVRLKHITGNYESLLYF